MLYSILSGILIGTSYIPFPPWSILFALVPLWYFWFSAETISYKKIFITGWLTQFILTTIGFHWIAHTVVEFGRLPWGVAILVMLLHSATQNLHIPIAGLLWNYSRKKCNLSQVQSVFVLALFTGVFETYYPMVFNWNMGYSYFWAGLPIYHWADTIGFVGLSIVTFLMNAAILLGVLNWKKSRRQALVFPAIAISIFVLLNISGSLKSAKWANPDREASVGVIQANIGNFEKAYAELQGSFRPKIYNQYFDLSRQFLNDHKSDFMLWPETAFPDDLDKAFDGGVHQSALKQFINSTQTPLLTGAYSTNVDTNEYYNGMFLFDKSGERLDKYRKSHLLAFGEYFPGSDIFPSLKKLIPAVSNFGRGKGPKTFILNDLRIGPQICYEGLYPEFSAEQSLLGANLLVNVTNDSWFGHTFEPRQHLYMTLARAIEVRRPMVRSTNTGISAAILSDGTILEQGPEQEEWAYNFPVRFFLDPETTLYARFGRIVPLLFLFFLITLLVWAKCKNPKNL